MPAEAKHSITRARVVRQGQLWAKARTTWADGDGYGHRASAGHRVGGKLLADTADRAATFGKRERGWGCRRIARSALRICMCTGRLLTVRRWRFAWEHMHLPRESGVPVAFAIYGRRPFVQASGTCRRMVDWIHPMLLAARRGRA